MKTSWYRLVAVLLLCQLLGGNLSPSRAEEDEKPLSKDEKEQLEAKLQNVKDLVTAQQMASFGRKYKAPEALVAAGALLLKVNAATGGNVDKKVDLTAVEKGTDTEAKSLKEQADELFDTASGLKTSKEIETIITEAKKRDYSESKEFEGRAVLGGPKRISRRVDAGGLHRFNLNFVANQPGTVAVTSDRPVRFIIRLGESTLNNSVVTSYHYTFMPRGRGVARKVEIEVRGMGSPAHFTVYAN